MRDAWNGSALRRSAKVSLTGQACRGAGADVRWTQIRNDDDRARSYSPSWATIPDSAAYVPKVMVEPLPVVQLKNAWNSTHPWIFQRLVEKPAQRPKPGSIVDVVGVDGVFIGRGFYNGHSRIALRMLERDPDVAVDADWFVRKIGEAVRLRREFLKLDEVSNAWRVVHSEGDGISGLVVDRYDDLIVVEFFSAGAWRHRSIIFDALREHFPGCRFHSFADEHVQKQESFDYKDTQGTEPAIVTEHGIRFRADPAGAHKTGFFADQRENREWLSRQCEGRRVLDLCCNTGGFGVYAAARGASEVVGIDIDPAVIEIAKQNAHLNKVKPRFIQADIFPWLRDAALNGEQFDVVILDPAKMTRDREQVINALKKYLDMNKLALGVVKPGGLFATFSCTGLVSEEQFTDMLRRAAFYAGRTVQVLKVAGAGPDHPWLAQVQESRYLKAVFCRVLD